MTTRARSGAEPMGTTKALALTGADARDWCPCSCRIRSSTVARTEAIDTAGPSAERWRAEPVAATPGVAIQPGCSIPVQSRPDADKRRFARLRSIHRECARRSNDLSTPTPEFRGAPLYPFRIWQGMAEWQRGEASAGNDHLHATHGGREADQRRN